MTSAFCKAPIVIVGLGNPGKQYEGTRHNIGNAAVCCLAEQEGIVLKEDKRFQGFVGRGRKGTSVGEEKGVHLLLPTTYMNHSGRAVRRYLDYYKIGAEHVIIVTDDVALPFGQLRLREKGSAGGHNGLKSVEAHLGTRDYLRLRMGVSEPKQRQSYGGDVLADYVLSGFSSEEKRGLEVFLNEAVVILGRLIEEEVGRVMNEVNTKKMINQSPESSG